MLAYALLKLIADYLANLKLDPVLRLKIVAAIVAPLMGGAEAHLPSTSKPLRPNGARFLSAEKTGKGRQSRFSSPGQKCDRA
jgi:hypothetical protein